MTINYIKKPRLKLVEIARTKKKINAEYFKIKVTNKQKYILSVVCVEINDEIVT